MIRVPLKRTRQVSFIKSDGPYTPLLAIDLKRVGWLLYYFVSKRTMLLTATTANSDTLYRLKKCLFITVILATEYSYCYYLCLIMHTHLLYNYCLCLFTYVHLLWSQKRLVVFQMNK